jgi:hypothetical protein
MAAQIEKDEGIYTGLRKGKIVNCGKCEVGKP